MGTINAKFLVATGLDDEKLRAKLHELADIFEIVERPLLRWQCVVNGRLQVCLLPSGSEEGWPRQQEHAEYIEEVSRICKDFGMRVATIEHLEELDEWDAEDRASGVPVPAENPGEGSGDP